MATVEHTALPQAGKIPLTRRISELMQQKGDSFSIRAFATRIGISRELLRLILIGERPITPSTLNKISQGLGISVERLRQVDTFEQEQELTTLLKANKRTKPMMIRAHAIASELVKVARGFTERGYALNNLGRVHYLQQQYDDAHQTWLDALQYANQLQENFDDNHLLHLVSTNLMLTHTIRKDYSNIEELLHLVEEAFRNDPDKLGMAQYTRMIVQEDRGNLELAKKHAYRSLEFFEQTHDDKQIGRALINVAHFEYLTGNYNTSATLLSVAIEKVRNLHHVIVHAVKEYAKSLMQLHEYETVVRVVEEYASVTKEYPDYWGKLQIMYTVATDDSSYAESIINDSKMSLNVRYLACKSLMEFYYLKRDFESSMRYYEKSRIISSTKSEYLNEGGF